MNGSPGLEVTAAQMGSYRIHQDLQTKEVAWLFTWCVAGDVSTRTGVQASLKQKPLERVSGPSELKSCTHLTKRERQRSGLGDYPVGKGAEVLDGQHLGGEEMLKTKAGRLLSTRDRQMNPQGLPCSPPA